MRDKANYRAANTRAQAALRRPFCSPHRGGHYGPDYGFSMDPSQEGLGHARDLASGFRNSMADRSIGFHGNGIDTIPMEWIPMHCIPIHSIPMDKNRPRDTVGDRSGKRAKESGAVHYDAGNVRSPGGENNAQMRCLRLKANRPSVPHTVYVKSLYRIGGQECCRHHIVRAAVAAGVITEVKPGAGSVVTVPRE